jgi:mRNA export factor
MALFGSSAPAAASTTTGDTSKDVEVQQSQLPSDSIQDLQFSPTNDFLAVGSWDKKVYIYEVAGNGANGKWLFECPGHVLGVGWSKVRSAPRARHTAALALTHVLHRTARA